MTDDIDREPRFGVVIRAARLGYHWAPQIGAFLRISGEGPFVFDLAPASGFPSHFTKSGDHRVWWENEKTAAAILEAPCLKGIRRVNRAFQMTVGEDGERLDGVRHDR